MEDKKKKKKWGEREDGSDLLKKVNVGGVVESLDKTSGGAIRNVVKSIDPCGIIKTVLPF